MNVTRFFVFLFILVLSMSAFVEGAELKRIPTKMLLQSLDNYVVDLRMKNDKTVHVTQSFDIVSRHKDPIIPGRAKLVLYNGVNPRNVQVNVGGSIKNVKQRDIIEEDGNNVIYYEIWRPISPKERLNIEVNFDTDINAEGFLFKQLDLKFGEPELPVDKMVFSLQLPPGKTITYSDPELTEKKDGSGTMVFNKPGEDNQASLTVEYSSLPLPTLPFHGYWLWLLLVLVSFAMFLVRLINKNKINLPKAPFSE